ncbi:Hypp6682 [Branchiostoma lanceolatum]|uniref:Hypp6682 protein n=1 Tax=Branchiostoma lanceolatum TaxID=7740 RepID=A0A8J9YVI4_BRALA|nr:Hypp6682 [Branchiostoma lanceolatum]
MPRGRTQEVHLTRKPIMLVPAGTTTVPRRAARVDMTEYASTHVEIHNIFSSDQVKREILQAFENEGIPLSEGHDIGSAGEVRIDSLQGRQLTAILQGKGVEDVPHRISERKALLKRLVGGAEMELEKKIARLEDNDKLKDHVSLQQSKHILKNKKSGPKPTEQDESNDPSASPSLSSAKVPPASPSPALAVAKKRNRVTTPHNNDPQKRKK